jgi:hypothetical protein
MLLHRYALPHAKTGDVIAIGETPLAIMQGAASDLLAALLSLILSPEVTDPSL